MSSTFKPRPELVVNAALWSLRLRDALVYSADEGTTKSVGATQRFGCDVSARYCHLDSRPAIEGSSVRARGYCLLNALLSYTRPRYKLRASVQNLLHVDWNEVLFATTSQLRGEAAPVTGLSFTPGPLST